MVIAGATFRFVLTCQDSDAIVGVSSVTILTQSFRQRNEPPIMAPLFPAPDQCVSLKIAVDVGLHPNFKEQVDLSTIIYFTPFYPMKNAVKVLATLALTALVGSTQAQTGTQTAPATGTTPTTAPAGDGKMASDGKMADGKMKGKKHGKMHHDKAGKMKSKM